MMTKPTQRERDLALWNSLNDRQRHYLRAVYAIDQEHEQHQKSRPRSAWWAGGMPKAAEFPNGWRWMRYHPINNEGTTQLQDRIGSAHIDPGTGSTFDALERRKLIDCKYRRLVDTDLLYVMMTASGRRVIRAADPEHTPKPARPKGWLQEWHWAMLAKLYADHINKDQANADIADYRWGTFLRLRDYTPEPLADEMKDGSMITGAGRAYYERHYAAYRAAYPGIDAPPPIGDAPPTADEDDRKTVGERKRFQEAVVAFCKVHFPDTAYDGKPAWNFYRAARAYHECNSIPVDEEITRRFKTTPGSRDQFHRLCHFANLTASDYPRLGDYFPPPDSDRARFAADFTAWITSRADFQNTFGVEVNGIGFWSRHRFSDGLPMQPSTFLHLCRYCGFDPANYPSMNGAHS